MKFYFGSSIMTNNMLTKTQYNAMTISKTRLLFLISVFSLTITLLIYLLFRGNQIKLIGYFDSRIMFLHFIRLQSLKIINSIPQWIIFNLPDGLFVFSYTTLMLGIWHRNKYQYYWILFLPIALIIVEFSQLFKILKGTFDFLDIIFYTLFTTLTFLIKFKFYETSY